MMNIFSPFPPRPVDWRELPAEAARPRCWKSLGHLSPSIEAHYGIASMHGDMDIDRENDLRVEIDAVARVLSSNNALEADMVFAKTGVDLVVRIVACDCAERTFLRRN